MKKLTHKFIQWTKNHPQIYLWIILLLGSALRLYGLDKNSYFFDEIFSIYNTHISLKDFYFSATASIMNAQVLPLYYIVLNFWVNIFSSTESVTRLLSAIIGIVDIFLIYKTGKELLNREIGLIASFIAAISHFQIYFSQEIRYYALLELLTLLSFLYFIKYFKTRKKGFLIINCLANVLACYCHTFGIFTIFCQMVFMGLSWLRQKKI